MRAQLLVRPSKTNQVTFLSKKPGQVSVSYIDPDYLSGEDPSHSGDGAILIGEPSYVSDFPTLPSRTSQPTQDLLSHAWNQSGDFLPFGSQ